MPNACLHCGAGSGSLYLDERILRCRICNRSQSLMTQHAEPDNRHDHHRRVGVAYRKTLVSKNAWRTRLPANSP